MGEITNKTNSGLELELNKKFEKNSIKLNSKSSMLFANLNALALAACGGGGGSSSTPVVTPTPTVNNAPVFASSSLSFTEDTPSTFSIGAPTDEDGDSLTITVDSIPTGITLTAADGTIITAGITLTSTQLAEISFSSDTNTNSSNTTFGDLKLSASDGTATTSATIAFTVEAVNDNPTLNELSSSALEVKETVAANVTLLTVTALDVEGEAITFSLSGDDANLFSVDASGNVSFIASPNFKAPGDVGSDNVYNLNVVATDASGGSASRALSVSVLDVKPVGQAIDGYLVGATVWVDLDGDGIKDANEPETSTDKTGAFEFDLDVPANTDIYVEGGYDLGTGKPNEQKFKMTTSVTGDGSEALVISPVSTQISRAYAKTGVTIEQAQDKVAKAYGLDEVFDNLTSIDPIALAYSATTNEQAKAALTAQARNIMVSSLSEVSIKVSEYFATEIAPTTRSQISDIFKFGTQTLSYSTWDSGVDLKEQPRIVIELEGFEDLLAGTSETFNDKIVEAILASDDLTKLFEMKSDGTGQFDVAIQAATSAIITEIKNLILSEMGFDPATNFTTFKSLENYTGETVTFLGSTKTMAEWAVLMVDVLDSQQPDPYSGLVNFGPDGGVTDMVGKHYAEQMTKMVRLMETMTGLTFENLTDSQIDQLVDMGLDYSRASTFNDSYTRWVPFDEFGQELWSQAIYLSYSGERFRFDSQGNEIQGNSGQWQLTGDQIKDYLKNPATQLKDGNWGNEFNTYNWTTTTGDLGIYLALAQGRDEAEVKVLMDALTATPESISSFVDILTDSFGQGAKVFTTLVTGALDFTLDKFEKFVEKTLDYENDEVRLFTEALGLPVSTINTVTVTVPATSATDAANVTVLVTVANVGDGNKFYLDGVLASDFTFTSGSTYTFDQSDSSNAGHPLRFSETLNGTHDGGAEYSTGVTTSGTPGSSGANTIITVSDTTPTLYYYCEIHSGMANNAVLTSVAAAVATTEATYELETITGVGWQIDPNYGDLNPIITEPGSYSYAITGGPDAALFRISDLGTIAFKDTAPNSASPNDSDANGEYLITVTVTDDSDGFTQEIEYILAFPDYENKQTYASDVYPVLNSAQQVITIPEGQWAGARSYYDEDTQQSVEFYKGIRLDISGLDSTSWVELRDFNDEGNPIKDNQYFNIRQYEDEPGVYYLVANYNGGQPVFDYEAPKDANGDNVYELVISARNYGNSTTELGTSIEMLVVISDNAVERAPSFPDFITSRPVDEIDFSYSENEVPVASLTEVVKNGITLNSYFFAGNAQGIDNGNPDNEIEGGVRNTEQLLSLVYGGAITTTITGGADADIFYVYPDGYRDLILFKARPSFAEPADADADNVFEVELTRTSSNGDTTVELIKIEIREAEEGSVAPLAAPETSLIIDITEDAEEIGAGDESRSIVGNEGNNIFTKKDLDDGFKYVDGKGGDDVFAVGRNHLTGGDGADTFLISLDTMENAATFGIVNNAEAYVAGRNEGIFGYDQNRDGTLDLATELDYAWVNLISDFTPGTDKIALTTYGYTGTNVPTLDSSDIYYVQGTGDMSAHTLIVVKNASTEERGYTEGGVVAVLLDTAASSISKVNDEISVGAKYSNILGNLGSAIGASQGTVTASDGKTVDIMQTADGQYIFLYADYNTLDNRALYEGLAVSLNGEIYVPRGDGPDFEAPEDANKDNIYEFLFKGATFSNIVLNKSSWGGYQVDWEASTRTGDIAFTVFLNVNDDISDNVGKISIAEANFITPSAGSITDGTLDTTMVDLVLSQLSAVQGSLQDIDMKAIAEEINFDFSFFAMADARTQAEDWFGDYQTRSFEDFGSELESTFERNLLSKYSSYTNADSLSNLTGTAENDTIEGTDTKETIFGKKGDDTITGGAGDDVIFGDQGADTLDGGPGADAMDGGSGNDRLIVGEGLDVMDGGSGDDTFDFTNITSLPEYIKGGSGTDTLVLSGLSSSGLETEDGADADSLPDYTGISLQKVVSIKETWTYQDDAGNTVNEEGWRNRVESIEAIDLRDSQSINNQEYNQNPLETLGFRLASNKLTLTDSDGAIHSIYTSASASSLSANLVGGSLGQANLANIVSSDISTGISPVLRFQLDSIPEANTSGTSTVTMKLYDGSDATQSGSERLLETTLVLNWSSDGKTVTVTLPNQDLTINYQGPDGSVLTRNWTNIESDAVTVTSDTSGFPGLDLRIASFFSNEGTAEGIDLTGYISSGDYFFDVSFSNLEFLDQNDNSFTSVQGGFAVAATPAIAAYIDNIETKESSETALVTVNLSKASSSNVTVNYTTSDGTATAGSDYTTTSGTLTILAGQTSGTITIPVTKDAIAEGPENFKITLSDPSGVSLGRSESTISINNETVFNDVLNISWDALQQMSWDNRTWTIRGDDTDIVRLLGHEYTYNSGSSLLTEFEPFRYKGTKDVDGVTYQKFELWDGIVLIEEGVSVIFGRRELGKAVAGQNVQPDFWYQYKTVYENSLAVFGAVKDSWDRDGDTLTFSLDTSFGDHAKFDINTTTGEVTFKTAPNYEAPANSQASFIGTAESDFASLGANQLRELNRYQIKVVANDGSGESNATNTQQLYIEVRNLPDYEGYDPTNKIPFFKDMWGSGSQFIDDAANQEIQIKGFDLNFDALTWQILGVEISGGSSEYQRYGTMQNGETGSAIANAPFSLSSTGLFTPNSTLSYETGPTNISVYVSITDGKSAAVTKQYYFQVIDNIADGSLAVQGTAMTGSFALAKADIWQDLDNDGVKDAGEPSAVTDSDGRFNIAVTTSSTDAPILASGGIDMGTGLANSAVLKINSNLKLSSGRDWGEYSLSPGSSVSLSMQNLDRSLSDQKSVTDTLKAFGMDPLWMDGDGNFYGERFYDIANRLDGNSNIGEWETFNLNVFTLNNLITLLGQSAAKAGEQIITDALADVNAKVSGTTNVSSYAPATLTDAQILSVKQASNEAVYDAIAELVTGKTVFDGFRLSESNPVTITDHEGSIDVKHTPSFSVTDNVLTLNSANIEINQAAMQSALNLESGAKGLLVEVELGTLPTTAETIEFTGKLIDGTDGVIDSLERSIEVRFQVLVDPTKEVGAVDYVYVPSSSDLTIIYTGEDGTATSTTVAHSGNMVTIKISDTGVPKFVVDFNEIFSRGIPETNLETYFTTSTASNGNYYTELSFAGSSLKTTTGESFNKVVAPFKIATSTTPVIYFNDISVSEAEGWNQITLTLSKPATETFTVQYKIDGGTATVNEDYWWWSDDSGYRSVTFVQGQTTAVVNVDIRNDNSTEGDETIIYGFSIASGSEGKVILPKNTATVTIGDDESSTGISIDSLTEKVLAAIKPILASQLKTLTDANSADLSSTSTTFSNILLNNSDVSDISAYLTGEVSEDITLYDPILKAVLSLVNSTVSTVRGPSGIREGLKVDGSSMAKDFAALGKGFDALNLSEFISTSVTALNQALIDDIYSDSGFKYTGATTVDTSAGKTLVYARTIDSDSSAYSDLGFPAGADFKQTTFDSGGFEAVTIGTSGADTVNLSTDNNDTVYFAGAGDDVITLSGQAHYLIKGGDGNDIIKTTVNSSYRQWLEGGSGNDTLAVLNTNSKVLTGGTGSDTFVLEHAVSYQYDGERAINGYDQNQDGVIGPREFNEAPLIITDFEDGSDKIGLKGSGWEGKTIVITQGTGTMSNHTMILAGTNDKGGDSDVHYWAIVFNTSAGSITAADFVLIDSNYASSALSGVTISTSTSDAGLSEDASLEINIDDSSLQVNSVNGVLEQAPSLVFNTSIIEDDNGFNFDNLETIAKENQNDLVDISDVLEQQSSKALKDTSDLYNLHDYSALEDLRDEDILTFLDTI